MARSESMMNARRMLVVRWGESYGQTKWVDLMQRYGVMPWDECPQAMFNDIKS